MSKKKKMAVIISCICLGLAVVILGWFMLCGYLWSWGPFSGMADARFRNLPGNGKEYSLERVEPLADSPLEGLRIGYLGSSVTYGAASLHTSFVEYIAKRNGTEYVKEAVSGTTLVDEGVGSYISRLRKMDTDQHFDLFVCQLSTNDATQNKSLGRISPQGTQEFDTHTVCGAMEYIVNYVADTWNCPVVFYTNAYYESAAYADMVEALAQLGEKYDIGIIDMYTDEAFNDITAEQRDLYMADDIHPTRAGYLLWWTPFMENCLGSFAERAGSEN